MHRPKTRLIAVEDSLTPVAEALREKGYAVRELGQGNLHDVKAVVVSGQDENMLGVQSVKTQAPVILAEGKTADEIVRDLEERLGPLGV